MRRRGIPRTGSGRVPRPTELNRDPKRPENRPLDNLANRRPKRNANGNAPGGLSSERHFGSGSNAGNTSGVAVVDARRATPPGPWLPHWGLAGFRPLQPSHPALATFKHAEVESCPYGGTVRNQRFSGPHARHLGPHRRQLAPSWASSQKKPAKIVKNVMENGAKHCRFRPGFPTPSPPATRSISDSR